MGQRKGNNVSVRRVVLEKCSGKRRGDHTPQWIPLPRGAVTDSGRGDLPQGPETPPRRADDFGLETWQKLPPCGRFRWQQVSPVSSVSSGHLSPRA